MITDSAIDCIEEFLQLKSITKPSVVVLLQGLHASTLASSMFVLISIIVKIQSLNEKSKTKKRIIHT